MKKLFAMSMAALAVTACTNEDVLTPNEAQNGNALTFSTYVPTTKATTQEAFKPGDKFGVFAAYTGETDFKVDVNYAFNFMNDQAVEMNNSGEWFYNPVKYWPKSGVATLERVHFFAYHPMIQDAAALSLAEGDVVVPATKGLKITYKADKLENQVDFLVARAYNQTEGDNSGKAFAESNDAAGGLVQLRFQHALYRVGYKVKLVGMPLDKNTSVRIDSISFGHKEHTIEATAAGAEVKKPAGVPVLISSADYDFLSMYPFINKNGFVEKSSDRFTATLLSKDLTYNATFDKGSSAITIENKPDDYLMLIPQSLSAAAHVSIEYTIITEDEDGFGSTKEVHNIAQFPINKEMVAGKAYTWTFEIGLTAVDFDVDVQSWGTEDNKTVEP